MGRIAGVTAAETRERLLRAAAGVFAERGYDGTRVADIATAAGVSNSALYAHFASKAELLVDALRTHGRRLLADMFAADPGRPITDLLLIVGRRLPAAATPRATSSSRRWSRPVATRTSLGRCATTSASGPTGSPILCGSPRPVTRSTPSFHRTRSPTSASCSPWEARTSHQTCTRSMTKSGPPISSDPPFHHDARKLLLPAFTKTAVARQEPATRAFCHTLIDTFEGRDVVDAAYDYAQHIPMRVIADMLGFPPEDGPQFREFVENTLEGINRPEEERIAHNDADRLPASAGPRPPRQPA